MTADLLANLALETLTPATDQAEAPMPNAPAAGPDDPVRPDQYVRAEVLLDLALEQAPWDAELWRLRTRLAQRLGDRAAQVSALERYVQLRPDDDAVRLQLILLELSELETVDGRLALLERYLADQDLPGRTPALVSRLSSAAAATARELGDEARFLQHLRVAGRQGVANAQAAGLTLAFAESRGAKPEQLAAAAVNLVRADPLNPAARRALAARLLDVAAYERAAQQYEVSTRLSAATPLSSDELSRWVRALIGAGRLDLASAQLAAWEAFVFGDQTSDKNGAALQVPPAPAAVVLLRCVLDGEEGGGPAAFARVAATLRPAIERGDNDAALELAWMTALFGADTQPVAELLRGRDAQDPRYLRASGFVYQREGATDWARKAFERVDDDDISTYGLALLTGRDDAGTARQLRRVVARFPGSFGAALANHRLQAQGRAVTAPAVGRSIRDLMNRSPATLWTFDTRRNPWVSVQASLNTSRHLQFEPLRARVTLQNLTDLPLPLSGLDPATQGPTAVVSVSTYAGGRPIGSAPSMVSDLGRRLVLMPGERLNYDLRIDRSRYGLALARTHQASVTFNSTFVVGPEIDAEGGFGTGAIGGIDTVRASQVVIESATPENIETWITRLENPAAEDTQRDRFAALGRAGAAHPHLKKLGIETRLIRRVASALNDAFAAADDRTRAFALLTLGADTDPRSPLRTLFDLAVRSEADLVRVAHLAGHVTDPLDPTLVSAIRDGSPRLRRFAQALSTALKQEPPSGGAR